MAEPATITRPLISSKRHKSIRKNSRRIYSPYHDDNGPSDDEDKDGERVDSNDPEEMFQNIQFQKEIIANIRIKPWPIRRKLKVLKQAREIVLKYEGRLTRTRGYQAAGADLLKKISRVLYNIVVLFIPWEMRIKKIESHFGSGVASYFIFLRWLFGINIVLTIMTGAFIVLPELLAGAPFGTTRSKTIPKEHFASAQDLDTIWSLGPEYGEFKIAENVLHLIYNQGMIWMGAFFSPCLPAFNVLKLIGLMYLRSWAVLTCNVPHQQVFKASRSNNFYLAMLLFMLFLCMLPTIFAIVRYRPSQYCGPFSGQEKIYDIISETIANDFPLWFSKVMSYVTSPVVVLPALLLLFMLIYYLQSIARSLKFTNSQLRLQLQTERTDDKKKVFQLAAARLQAPEGGDKNPEQESDITSVESSARSASPPRRNGSVSNFESPIRPADSIQTITQSASRSDVPRAARASRSPSVPVRQKHKVEHAASSAHRMYSSPSVPQRQVRQRQVEFIPIRHSGYMGSTSGSSRSKSYHNMAYNPCTRYTENIHSDPLFRKTLRPMHTEPSVITAQSYVGRRAHTTRYVIVNEHDARKMIVRTNMRIPRHYRLPDEPEIVELYPRNVKCYIPRTPHRSHQPHLSEEVEEDEEDPKTSTRRGSSRPKSLSDIRQTPRFYIGDNVNSQLSMEHGIYGDEEEYDQEDDWVNVHPCSQTSLRGPESTHRYGEHYVKPKTKHKVEPSLTESDSASLASSSDQQNSSTDQYIQVIHNKEKYLKPSAKMTKKKAKNSVTLNVPDGNDLVCSNV
ncbi:transmembrane channel-like protein 3 [Danio aesculapii]|uniref:transmembrane channel-like protein 3 n=1 Tax=Danio aesculapii TaxID=1142201 RepID=UPI0024BFBACE|nr:transmembrane channel-like protein 3 [Danio aesculapii]